MGAHALSDLADSAGHYKDDAPTPEIPSAYAPVYPRGDAVDNASLACCKLALLEVWGFSFGGD